MCARARVDMGLRDIESTLPPGFRFFPSDEELVFHYLYKKVANVKVNEGTMMEVDLHIRDPWELPGTYYVLYSLCIYIPLILSGSFKYAYLLLLLKCIYFSENI